jgi:hypothetical protein
MVGKAQKSHGARSGLYDGCSNGVPPIHFSKPNTEFISDLSSGPLILRSHFFGVSPSQLR